MRLLACLRLVALANELGSFGGVVTVDYGDSVADDADVVPYMGC
jgi:hypothetical protein